MPTVVPWANDSTAPASAPALRSTSSDGGDDADRLILGRGRQLRRVDPLAVQEDRVGEGSPDVDAEQHAVRLADPAPGRRSVGGRHPSLSF